MENALGHDTTEAAERALARERRIRDTAYEKFRARDSGPGDALSDWLAAEAEVDAEWSPDSGAPVQEESIGRNSRITPPRG